MKKFFITLFISIIFSQSTYAGSVSSNCTYNGIPLYGKVKVVTSFEDIRVKRVTAFEDIKVRKVNSFATSCGKWQFVDSFEDFKIRYVDSFEDIKVKFVDSFEGI